MKKLTFLFAYLLSTSTFASSSDCQRAWSMVPTSVNLVVQALKMHKADADYKTIAQWRVNTFNPQIDKLIDANPLTPQDMMNPDLEITREVYNEVMMRSKILVGEVYAHAQGRVEKSAVDEQRVMVNNAVQHFKSTCATQ